MPLQTTKIETTGPLQCLGAAKFIAVFTYPDHFDRRTKFVNACRALSIKDYFGGTLPTKYVWNEDILMFRETRAIERQFDTATKIISEKRAMAVDLGLISIFKNVLKEKCTLSVNNYMASKFPYSSDANAENYGRNNAYGRIWSPSKKILHLLTGFQNALHGQNMPWDIIKLIRQPDWVEFAVADAERARRIYVHLGIAGIKEEETIQLIPDPSSLP